MQETASQLIIVMPTDAFDCEELGGLRSLRIVWNRIIKYRLNFQ